MYWTKDRQLSVESADRSGREYQRGAEEFPPAHDQSTSWRRGQRPCRHTVFGYQYDGGFMAPTGIPSRKIGTPTTTPGDYVLGLGQLPYIWIQPPDPSFDPLSFNFNS